jgi:uncharacterized protein YcbK (DUF882 family)
LKHEEIDLTKRSFIKMAATLGATAAICPLSSLMLPDSAMAEPMVPLRLFNPHTGETYSVELFSGSQWNKSGLLVCDWMMRDWRQKQVVNCDRKIYAALYVIQRKFTVSSPISINSGFRSNATNQMLRSNSISRNKGRATSESPAVNSQHLYARAVDFSIPGVPVPVVSRYVKSLNIGGLGVYSTFTHMDTGRVRQWGKAI